MKRKTSQITAGSFKRRIKNGVVTWVNSESISWSLKQKQLFIDSILSEFDTQKIYVYENSSIECKVNVLDGIQRLISLVEFYNNDFPLSESNRLILGVLVSGCTYSQLKEELKNIINAYEFTVVTLANVDNKTVADIRCRLNANNLNCVEFNQLKSNVILDNHMADVSGQDKNFNSVTSAALLDIEKDSKHYDYKTSKLSKLYNKKTNHGKIAAWIKNNKTFNAHDLVSSGSCDAANKIEYYEEFIAYREFFNLINKTS